MQSPSVCVRPGHRRKDSQLLQFSCQEVARAEQPWGSQKHRSAWDPSQRHQSCTDVTTTKQGWGWFAWSVGLTPAWLVLLRALLPRGNVPDLIRNGSRAMKVRTAHQTPPEVLTPSYQRGRLTVHRLRKSGRLRGEFWDGNYNPELSRMLLKIVFGGSTWEAQWLSA